MRYTIYWKLVQRGTSHVEADSQDEARQIAEERQTDFGDPEDFEPDVDIDDTWTITDVLED